MKKFSLILLLNLTITLVHAQGPEVTSWIINTTGATGYNNIPSNVQLVRYGTQNVYVSTTCIPSYTIGPWPGNPNTPVNQNFVFKITRTPVENTGTPVATGLGHIGVWSNGVSIYNPLDAMSYQNQNVWHQDAYFWEGSGFDNCLGHPSPNGEYHHHVNPTCLYDDDDSLNHSPIIGYAFDGFPVYGAYGYDQSLTPGPVRRMITGFEKRNMTVRDSLPNGTAAYSNGPPINGTYPLGAYVEDYKFISGSGDLDEHNGRFCVTPDYPAGTYAYFVSIDDNQNPVYPYVIGSTYYGTVQSGNTGPGSGHNVPSETVVTYTTTGISEIEESDVLVFPNPSSDKITVSLNNLSGGTSKISITELRGKIVFSKDQLFVSGVGTLDISELPQGFYWVKIETNSKSSVIRFLKY